MGNSKSVTKKKKEIKKKPSPKYGGGKIKLRFTPEVPHASNKITLTFPQQSTEAGNNQIRGIRYITQTLTLVTTDGENVPVKITGNYFRAADGKSRTTFTVSSEGKIENNRDKYNKVNMHKLVCKVVDGSLVVQDNNKQKLVVVSPNNPVHKIEHKVDVVATGEIGDYNIHAVLFSPKHGTKWMKLSSYHSSKWEEYQEVMYEDSVVGKVCTTSDSVSLYLLLQRYTTSDEVYYKTKLCSACI